MIEVKDISQATNNQVEKDYSKLISLEHRKKFAQFFTPFQLASLMADWLLGNQKLKTVLEPAFGLGIFTRALLSKKSNLSIKALILMKQFFPKQKRFSAIHQTLIYSWKIICSMIGTTNMMA